VLIIMVLLTPLCWVTGWRPSLTKRSVRRVRAPDADRIDLLDVDPKVLRKRLAERAVFARGEAASALAATPPASI
jgi:hypothetical protein